MAAPKMKHFDTLEYVKKAREFGFKEDFAEYQARQFESVLDTAISTMYETVKADANLATKKDLKELELSIKELELSIKALEAATKKDLKELEATTKRELKELEATTKRELKELEATTKREFKELDVKLTQYQLATHTEIKDLHLKLEQYRYESIKFIIWTGISVIISLGGLLAKGFHWF